MNTNIEKLKQTWIEAVKEKNDAYAAYARTAAAIEENNGGK